jgi:hypothetical protein
MGWNVLFATLNHINEKDQKIIDSTNATYVFTLWFNLINLTGLCFLRCEFKSKIVINR